jgi:thiamine biosynthesis lipoprotein
MGCRATAVVVGPSELLSVAREHIDDLERAWSRFLPDSDITRLNLADGAPLRVQPSTVRLVGAMIDGWRATAGAFDPTLLVPLVALGYSQSWCAAAGSTSLATDTSWRGRPDLIGVDVQKCIVQLPPGTALDAGGIGKGLAADMVADVIMSRGARGVLIDIGGDIAVRGEAPASDGWRIAVGADCGNRRHDASDGSARDSQQCIRLLSGGVATSGTEHRAWITPTGTTAHHLIDPHHGAPVVGVARETTVVAGTAAWAEAWTKALVVAGAGGRSAVLGRLDELDGLGLAARVRSADGVVDHNRAWDVFAESAGGRS